MLGNSHLATSIEHLPNPSLVSQPLECACLNVRQKWVCRVQTEAKCKVTIPVSFDGSLIISVPQCKLI